MTTLSNSTWINTVRRTLAALALGVTFSGPFAANLAAQSNDFGPTPDAFAYSNSAPAYPNAPAYRNEPSPLPTSYESRKPAFDANDLWQSQPTNTAPQYNLPQYNPSQNQTPEKKAEPTLDEQIEFKLSSRYGNPVVERFITGTSPDRLAQLYLETSQLIDSRHYEPSSYQARVDRSLANLQHAVRNAAFQRVHRLNVTAAAESAFDNEVKQYASTHPVRTTSDALRVMSGVAAIASRTLSLSPNAVAAEFIYGATESLDKYSAFNPEAPANAPSASTGLEDHVVGIGVEIKPHAQGVLVVKPVRSGPADKAGIQPGDIITNINGRELAGRTMDFAVDQIAGPAGSPILIGFTRDGRDGQVSMRRDQVRVYSVSEVKMIDGQNKVGYIKLDKFAEASDAEMDEALWSLYKQGMQSLVIDLRGNPGGLLTTAISLSDKFLPGGTIVSTKGRNAEDNSSESAHRARTWKTPLVVMVDENSASASEIFAAAIQENGRGVVVGRKSYGKGTVQTHFPLRTVGGNLKLTTARFYSPKGRVMAGAGVTPDVNVDKLTRDDEIVTLDRDNDVRQALAVAVDARTRDLATNAERTLLLGSR